MPIDIGSVALRGLSFVALFQAAGVAIFIAIFGRDLLKTARTIRRVGSITALFGVMLVSAHYLLEAARMAGELPGMWDMSLQTLVLHSALSVAWGMRVLGLTFIAIGLMDTTRRSAMWCSIGIALVVAAFTLLGHTAVHPDRAWLVALLLVHLVIVSFWFGALVPLYIVSKKETPTVAARVVDSFSRIAVWLVPGIFLAGVMLTWRLVDRWSVFAESYGLALIVKAASFSLLLGLATLNKWRFGPAIKTDPVAAQSLRRAIAFEYALIVGVLAVTAVMTTFFSPEGS